MSQAPSGPAATTAANAGLYQPDVGQGAPNNGHVTEKDGALATLQDLAIKFKDCDGRRRIFLPGTGDSKDDVDAAKSRFEEFWISDDKFEQGADKLNEDLGQLNTVGMSNEQADILETIQKNIATRGATAGDIVKLNALMQHVTEGREKGAEEHAYANLKFYAIKGIKAGRNRTFAWSQKNADLETRTKWCWNKASRKEAGIWLEAMFRPLQKWVDEAAEVDGGAAQKEFEYLMGKLKEGNIETYDLADLYEVVLRAKNPEQYARDTIKPWAKQAELRDPDWSIIWLGRTRQFYVKPWAFTTESGRSEASTRLMNSVSGLRPTFAAKQHLVADYQNLMQLATMGALKPRHGVYLQGILDQHDNPRIYALHELYRAYEMAMGKLNNAKLTWNSHQLGFEWRYDWRWVVPSDSCEQAGVRLADRLQCLRDLFIDDSRKKDFDDLIATIRSGDGRPSHIAQLKRLVDVQLLDHGEATLEHYLEQQHREIEATRQLDDLDLSENLRTGASEQELLGVLDSVVLRYHPNKHSQFRVLLGKVADNTATRDTIQALKILVNQARDNQFRYIFQGMIVATDSEEPSQATDAHHVDTESN